MDITQALKDAENSLRDFISSVLEKELGASWIDRCGVTPDRIEQWRNRKATEERRQRFGVAEERLIYYADFYDLKAILKKCWPGELSVALGDWKTMEIFLSELEKFRDSDAHRRELLPHQKHLALGISGDIRNRIVRYRSKKEFSDDYYPRFESVRDSLGNIFIPSGENRMLDTGMRLRPGDKIEFIVTATDPMGEELEFGIRPLGGRTAEISWQKDHVFAFTMSEAEIRKKLDMQIFLRSLRQHHAYPDYDDGVAFRYEVLPSK